MYIPELFKLRPSAASTVARGSKGLGAAGSDRGRAPLPFCRVERLERRTFLAAQPLATDDPPPTAGDVPGEDPDAPGPGTPTPNPVGIEPQVLSSSPANGDTNVARDSAIDMEVYIPNGGIESITVNPSTVYLYKQTGGERIPVNPQTTGGGDAIIVTPLADLQANTEYTVVVTPGVKDVTGTPFREFSASFTTGTSITPIDPAYQDIRFSQVILPTTHNGVRYLGLTMGPDKKLYATTDDGLIRRFPVLNDGTLGAAEEVHSLKNMAGGQRYVVGLAFDPRSTADNLIAWVTHTAPGLLNAPDWTGRIARLSGPNLENAKDVVINLPRSARDHLTNQPAFGPDGALYFAQASNSAMGSPDPAWSNRQERLLSAAILRLDVAGVENRETPLDAKTRDGGGSYDPYAAGAPLTFRVTGVRNAYDLLFHSNGEMYAPVNGSAAGGITPASPDGEIPAISRVSQSSFDVLYRVGTDKYYGHPNPLRKEYVLQGGNPKPGLDPFEITDYPVGVTPPANFRGGIFNFGLHESANGLIEYKNTRAFGGALAGKILITRYSGGDDVMLLEPSSNKLGIFKWQVGLEGLTGLRDPLDLAEDVDTGNLYVIEYNGSAPSSRITLLRVPAAGQDPGQPPPPVVPNIFIGDVSMTEGDSGTSGAKFEVALSEPTSVPVEVSFATADNTATVDGNDYLARTGRVRFEPGETTKEIIIQVVGDGDVEADEQFFVNLSSADKATIGDSRGVATVKNTDLPPPPERTKREVKLIARIHKFGEKKGLPVPDMTYTPGPELKGVFVSLKAEAKRVKFVAKVVKLATKKQFPVAGLNRMTIPELRILANSIKKYRPR